MVAAFALRLGGRLNCPTFVAVFDFWCALDFFAQQPNDAQVVLTLALITFDAKSCGWKQSEEKAAEELLT